MINQAVSNTINACVVCVLNIIVRNSVWWWGGGGGSEGLRKRKRTPGQQCGDLGAGEEGIEG